MTQHQQYLQVLINVRQRDTAKGVVHDVRNTKHGLIVGKPAIQEYKIEGYFIPREREEIANRISKQAVLKRRVEQVDNLSLDTGNTWLMRSKMDPDKHMLLGGPLSRKDLLLLAKYVIHEVATDEESRDILAIDRW